MKEDGIRITGNEPEGNGAEETKEREDFTAAA